ncbi:hypothetical protein RND81_03G185800 [Saponaria officinalis]|uniref:FBD domain-containing protein n=1 Tax=Saponaria officinalis TaxID=3572 RepID=A0AAW1M856_SAPOF
MDSLHTLRYYNPFNILRYECSPEIGPLISHLSQNGIQEMTLDNCSSSRLKLSSQFFSCLELEKFKLCRFDLIIPPSVNIFKNVTRIELECVTLTGRSYNGFISSCPALETLVIKGIDTQDLLVIDAPNLKLLKVEGLFRSSISLKGCVGLSSITIGLNERVVNQNPERAGELVEFLACSCELEELNLRRYFFDFLGDSGLVTIFSNTFHHLKKLQLAYIPLKDKMISSAIRIIRSCPNLEELAISFEFSNEPDEGEITDNADNVLQRLRKVYLTYPTGLDMEIKFIKFILDNARRLEKFYISSFLNRMPDFESKFIQKILRLRRVSNMAQVRIIDE